MKTINVEFTPGDKVYAVLDNKRVWRGKIRAVDVQEGTITYIAWAIPSGDPVRILYADNKSVYYYVTGCDRCYLDTPELFHTEECAICASIHKHLDDVERDIYKLDKMEEIDEIDEMEETDESDKCSKCPILKEHTRSVKKSVQDRLVDICKKWMAKTK